MTDTCQYCGGPANAWCGPDAWCSAPSCLLARDWATCEPQFYPFMDPTYLERLAGWFASQWFLFLAQFCSAKWIVYETGARHRFACWVFSNGYFWSERAMGRI